MSQKRKKCKFVADVVMQPPEVEEYDSGYFKPSGTGFFHQWGLKMEPDGNRNLVTVSIAIVEDCDTGQVYMVHPDNIKFINK